MYNGNEFFGLHSKGKSIELLLLKEIADFQNVVTIIETWQKAFFLNWVLLAALLELPIIKKTCKWWTIKKDNFFSHAGFIFEFYLPTYRLV